MVLILRIAFGAIFGCIALFFLFFGTLALRKDAAAGGVLLGIGAIAGAVTLYIASPRKAKSKKRKTRPLTPSGEPEERPLRREEPAEGLARYFDPRVWDFDLAKVTPAGWVFGLTSVAGWFVVLGFLVWLAEAPRLDLPRWAIKVFGPVLLAPVTAYFIFGAKLLNRLGYPVFRAKKRPEKASRRPGTASARGPMVEGLPPRRPPRSG